MKKIRFRFSIVKAGRELFSLTDLLWVERAPLRSQGVEWWGRKGGGKDAASF